MSWFIGHTHLSPSLSSSLRRPSIFRGHFHALLITLGETRKWVMETRIGDTISSANLQTKKRGVLDGAVTYPIIPSINSDKG